MNEDFNIFCQSSGTQLDVVAEEIQQQLIVSCGLDRHICEKASIVLVPIIGRQSEGSLIRGFHNPIKRYRGRTLSITFVISKHKFVKQN